MASPVVGPLAPITNPFQNELSRQNIGMTRPTPPRRKPLPTPPVKALPPTPPPKKSLESKVNATIVNQTATQSSSPQINLASKVSDATVNSIGINISSPIISQSTQKSPPPNGGQSPKVSDDKQQAAPKMKTLRQIRKERRDRITEAFRLEVLSEKVALEKDPLATKEQFEALKEKEKDLKCLGLDCDD